MAYGGWLRNRVTVGPYGDSGDTNQQSFITSIFNGLTSFSGWSTKRAVFQYVSGADDAWVAVAQHTSGAELALVFIANSGSAGRIHSSNGRNGQSAGGSSDWTVHIGYIPAAAASEFTNALDPDNAGWITDPSIVFAMQNLTSVSANPGNTPFQELFNAGQSAAFSWSVRDDDVILAIERDSGASTEVDHLVLMGSLFGSLFHDPNDTEDECYMHWTSAPAALTAPNMLDFFDAAGALILDGSSYVPTIELSTAAQNPPGAPYNAVQMMCYIPSATDVVYDNDGIKGLINPEALFLSSTGPAVKATWNGGTNVHVRSGLWVGSDVSNPAWP